SRSHFLRYAQSLIESGGDLLRFCEIEDQQSWLMVTMEVHWDHMKSRRVLVTAIRQKPPFELSPRELDVVSLVAAGLSNGNIAAMLEISPRTVTKHVENILRKTGQWTRTGLAALSLELGILRPPGETDDGPFQAASNQLARLHRLKPKPVRSAAGRGGSAMPVVIGTPLPVCELASDDAIEMANGAEMAVAEINSRGGVLGRELKLLTVACDVTSPQSVQGAYRHLIDTEVDAIVAGYSACEVELHEIIADYRAPYLHAATMDSVVERVRQEPEKLGNIFQVCASDVHYGPAFGRFVQQLEASGSWKPHNRRIVVVQPRWPGMDVGVAGLERILSKSGWKIDIIDGLPLRNIDWPPVVSKIHELSPSIVFLAYYFSEESAAFQRAFLANPLDSLIYTLYGPSIPSFLSNLGPSAEGILWATVTGIYNDAIGRTFAEGYSRRFGTKPGRSHAGIAYDRVRILADAWARAGNPRAFDRVADELRRGIHRGVNGSYFLGSAGQAALVFPESTPDPSLGQAHLVFQVQSCDHRILAPSLYSDGHFRLPPWFSRRN
ncbi:MAG: ABC transporter substrate-binding protein, partial [Proteobacteria bacterium]|nr:ABC transporter substrate-binding protein [Pseudomonadota bacterium]